ncbi:MAG TPA: VOC family protein [Candidatus Binatia bacterium]|nr:VOC family protein [Candidatus Binatia bacterium]
MAQIETFDHCGFIVEDIPRAERFYKSLFGAKTLHIANLNTRRLYNGWPIIMFMEMGGHRFELCLAQRPLAPRDAKRPFPRIGFAVTKEVLDNLLVTLREQNIAYEGPFEFPEPVPIERIIRVSDPDGNLLEFTTRR